jgi:hypothetical protein
MSIYLSVVAIIFGPLLLASFIRYLAARVRRNFHKSPHIVEESLGVTGKSELGHGKWTRYTATSTEAYREAGCVGSSGEDGGRLLEKLSEQMSIIQQLQIPITEQSQIPQN